MTTTSRHYKRKITIKSRLIISAFLIIVMLISTILAAHYYSKQNQAHQNLKAQLEAINSSQLEMQILEKDFLHSESINPNYYSSGKSEVVINFSEEKSDAIKNIQYLASNEIIAKNNFIQAFQNLNDSLIKYNDIFLKLTELVKAKGFKDYGLVGEWRAIIHNAEEIIKADNDLSANVLMLTLRRHEKDYLIRKDLKYQKKFNNVYYQFRDYLETNNNRANSDSLIDLLNQYSNYFNSIIAIDKQIGYLTTPGIIQSLDALSKENLESITRLKTELNAVSQKELKSTLRLIFIVLISVSIVILLTNGFIINEIIASNRALISHTEKLSRGELANEIKLRFNNEITDMIQNINKLTSNLKKSSDFALSLGKRNFNHSFKPLSQEDVLGNSLIKMRNDLQKAYHEQEARAEIDRVTNWTNKGMTQFINLMRNNSDNLKELSNRVISDLIEYIEAAQGGIYIVNNTKDNESYLELTGSHALSSNKNNNKEILIGEGLVGTCFKKDEKIYLENIPDNYCEINSGLGNGKSKYLLLLPLKYNKKNYGVLEILSLSKVADYKIEFLKEFARNLAAFISTIKSSVETQKLLEASNRQTQNMETKEQELVNNMLELQTIQEQSEMREMQLKQEIQQLQQKLENCNLTN